MTNLRFLAWNCHHGSLATRLATLAEQTPDIVFLQELQPTEALPLTGQFVTQRVNARKGIALGSLNPAYILNPLDRRAGSGRAVLAATVGGAVSFNILGIWSIGKTTKDYVPDVLQSLDAHADILASGPTVVMGDLNSGSPLSRTQPRRPDNIRLTQVFDDLGLISAYHAFHGLDHGKEKHATHRWRFKAEHPWHIDFCFIPKAWTTDLHDVNVLDGPEWSEESDHHPLVVDLRFR